MRRLAPLFYAFWFTLPTHTGFGPLPLRVEVWRDGPARGEVCLEIDNREARYWGDEDIEGYASRSCWRAEEQRRVNSRHYVLYWGSYRVTLTVDGKQVQQEPLLVACSEIGNNSDRPRCPRGTEIADSSGQ